MDAFQDMDITAKLDMMMARIYKMDSRLDEIEDWLMQTRLNVLEVLNKFAPNAPPGTKFYKGGGGKKQ